ncbi:FAD-binding domain-containing protein [Bacillus sp. JJ1609]|uniref:FAD-binding domain-containing protein n=1 Tax=Bacillus sp. JJ1609 TaxID=3122977 RepID=UPI002FFE0C0F
MNLVLFNKDIRMFDHQPLAEAAKIGEVLPLYVVEPSFWSETGLSARHFQFVLESLEELSLQIQERGGQLFFAIGEIEAVLQELLKEYESLTLYVHKETILKRSIGKWLDKNSQKMFTYGPEYENVSDKGFKSRWAASLKEPVIDPPKKIQIPAKIPELLFTDFKKLRNFKMKGSNIRFGQQGGEIKALETLESFLENRFVNYIINHDKPLPSSFSSSRLSAYLTWGNISERVIFQKTNERLQTCSDGEQRQLEEFLSKLYLRAKIIHLAKEYPVNAEMSALRKTWKEEWYQRWADGKTGIPIIDAAMRSLHKTGWLNFNLRGMVISFICNTLLLDCKKPSMALGELFLDFEPAIHNYYVEKQAGLSGKQKVKWINPIKIGKQHDPDGAFIRRYVPELSKVPVEFIHEPWLYPGFYKLGYPTPMVDVIKMNKHAKLQYEKDINKENAVHSSKKDGDTEQLTFDL